jgi:hypothetical protein
MVLHPTFQELAPSTPVGAPVILKERLVPPEPVAAEPEPMLAQ